MSWVRGSQVKPSQKKPTQEIGYVSIHEPSNGPYVKS